MVELILTVLLLGACSYRITRFLVLDSLMGMGTHDKLDPETKTIVQEPNSPLAAVIYALCYNNDGSDKGFLRGKLGDLVGCVFCTGAWVSFGAYAMWTWSFPWEQGVEFQKWWCAAFAVAGVQAFLSSRQDA